ncbi:hypothetical protein SAMN04515620_13431 [Collimonas sp. OK607]|uniref:hypothetical protein n=1 Tax=Collimonas sp. OK607 TaxID=1798194 RepID=UPI0008EA1E1B|nr:hypothetical protein [Collimonas sp. OK607]SFB27811.1 hypothetical protein SAMN04515620_13431 [Collimonas sp. OK607]
MSRAEFIKHFAKTFDVELERHQHAAPEIIAAIKKCMSELTDRDSRCSPISSIPKKVAKCIDQPFIKFVKDFYFPQPEWKISGLIKLKLGDADIRLLDWSKKHLETLELLQPHVSIYESAVTTIGLLRFFLRRCAIHVPGEVPAIIISEDGQLSKGTAKVRRGKNRQLSDKLPVYLQFFHHGYCELCFEPTAAKMKLDEMVRLGPKLKPEIMDLINDDAPLRLKKHSRGLEKHSPTYCDHHTPRAARGKDEKRRLHFYSAMRLISDVGVAIRAGTLEPSYLRRYAYWIAFLPGRMSSSLKQLPSAVASYHEEYFRGFDAQTIEELILLLRELEKKPASSEQWTKRCLKTLPSILRRLSDEEWQKNAESWYAEFEKKD